MEKIIVSVPGKVIIAGEYAVVYGEQALVATVDKRLRVKIEWLKENKIIIEDKYKDLRLTKMAVKACLQEVGKLSGGVKIIIDSEIPVGSGLGSSAAMATAVAWGMLKDRSEKVKNKVVKLIENKQHGRASGVDQTIVREGGVLRYKKSEGFKKIKLNGLKNLLLIDSGKPVESTGEMVAMVGKKKDEYKDVFKKMGEISNDWKPLKIKENQRLLEKIGVVGDRARVMVEKIEEVGGMAKVCGAGGVKKGSGILLGWHQDIDNLVKLAEKDRWQYYQVKLGVEGVKYEKN